MKASQPSHLDKEHRARVWGALVAVLGGFLFVFWAVSMQAAHNSAGRHKSKAESLAYQVFEIRKLKAKNRGPASRLETQESGQIGMSEEGKPYQYFLREEGSQCVVQVWSQDEAQTPTEVRIRKDQL